MVSRRTLIHARTVQFTHKRSNTASLLRDVANFVEDTGATLLNLHYSNLLDGGEFQESVVVTAECGDGEDWPE